MQIVFPEFNHPTIQAALSEYNQTAATPVTGIPAEDLIAACELLKTGVADAMIAGIEYDSRSVILACRDYLGLSGHTFSGLAVMQRGAEVYLLADMAACKHPSIEQLTEIARQTANSARQILTTEPRLALLSFSTNGSGGHDESIDLLRSVRTTLQSEMLIDGEMQLDAAINPAIGNKKFPNSPVAGQANVLIAPDLNTGNILYKAFEQLAGFTVAGPILQGFNYPVSDLSRGSSVADVVLTIETMAKLTAAKE